MTKYTSITCYIIGSREANKYKGKTFSPQTPLRALFMNQFAFKVGEFHTFSYLESDEECEECEDWRLPGPNILIIIPRQVLCGSH